MARNRPGKKDSSNELTSLNGDDKNELRSFVKRLENLAEEKRDIAETEASVKAEAKARGFNTKIINKLLAERRRDPREVETENSLLDLYAHAMGMKFD